MKKLTEELLFFKALADPLRLRLLQTICTEEKVCVCVLTEKICTSQSKLSYHLKMLLSAKLIDIYPDGKWNFYSIRLDTLQKFLSPNTINKILGKYN